MPQCGRFSPDVEIERCRCAPARGDHGSDQFEILEQDVAVVSVGPQQHAAPDAERSWPVASGHAIDERPSRIDDAVPVCRRKIVLGPHHIPRLEFASDSPQPALVVSHIVVRDDDMLIRRAAKSRQDARDFAICTLSEVAVDGNVGERRMTSSGVYTKNIGRRSVYEDNLSVLTDRLEVLEEREPSRRLYPDRYQVGQSHVFTNSTVYAVAGPVVAVW
jgi:hypothetical protein